MFAYDHAGGIWTDLDYNGLPNANSSGGFSHGIDAPAADTRYVAVNASNSNSVKPATDFQFDPVVTTYTGRLLLDEIVSDATGIGNSQNTAQPAAPVRVELLDGATVAATSLTDASGAYSLKGLALDSTKTGLLRLVAQSAAGRVIQTVGGAPHAITVNGSVSFAASANLGTFTVSDGNDASTQFRGALQTAMAAGTAWNWVSTRTATAVVPIDLVYDVSSATASTYSPAQLPATPPSARIASVASGNNDGFDAAVVMSIWGHHVIATLTAAPTQSVTPGPDVISTTENAFAEAFGTWLYTEITGVTAQIDGINGSTAASFDIETPQLASLKGPDVAGWVAAALWDLSDDSASESHDTIDGTGTTDHERPFTILAAMVTEPTPSQFFTDWTAQAFDGRALVRNFIHHGLFGDDAWEANDLVGEAANLGSVGIRLTGLVLNPSNEDWYRVSLGEPVNGLFADMTFNRFAEPATVTLQITDAAGIAIATGVPNGDIGPIEAATGPLLAGDYHVRVSHDAGPYLFSP